MIGKSLAHYKITSLIGKGGMGEVYQAKDQKLGRDVAIKVLPEEFAKDANRVARFKREAKLLASLNHPNIAAIYGLEESGGIQFLVLELVEGEALADQLKRGSIPVEKSLKLALQIAEALEAAHEKGVIHRDLKPANIKVTPEGNVKVLDFGLAKAFAGGQQDETLSYSPTLSEVDTQQGVILGTAAYMSPEQAKGKTVDKRADVWAFGVVLFEMLTGRQLFKGETVSETLTAVLMREPDFSTLPPNLHPRIRLLLERCLEKEGRNRCSGISDSRVEIQKALADPSGLLVQPAITATPKRKLRMMLTWIAAAFLLGLIIAGVAVWNLKPTPLPEPRKVTRFALEADGIEISTGIALSPDGSRLVYAAVKDGVRQLFRRALNHMTVVPIQDTKDALHPFFSPDGNWIGFFTESELKKVSLTGGVSQMICKAGYRYGATWGPDDTIVFATADSPGLMHVPASGGEPQPLIKSEAKPQQHRWPEFLTGGKAVLFTIGKGGLKRQVAILPLAAKTHHFLIDGTDAHFVPPGYLVFAREDSLWAIPFDIKHLEQTGRAAPVVEGVQVNMGGWAQYAVANDGTLAYLPSELSSVPPNRLIWVDRQGNEEPIAVPPHSYFEPQISPDGTRLALTVADSSGNRDIRIWDFDRENLRRLTRNAAIDSHPLWTTDGKRVAFFSSRENSMGIYWQDADGAGKVELLCSGQFIRNPSSWSGDGKTFVFSEGIANSNIGALSMGGDHTTKLLLNDKYSESSPQISPDGRWMAYASDESGQYEVYVRPFPDVESGGKWQVSTNGGTAPLWSRDGREIFYLNGDAAMAVSVETQAGFSLANPKLLFHTTYVGSYPIDGTPWDVSLDGKRFLMIKQPKRTQEEIEAGIPRKINIVLNWFEELKQKMPTD